MDSPLCLEKKTTCPKSYNHLYDNIESITEKKRTCSISSRGTTRIASGTIKELPRSDTHSYIFQIQWIFNNFLKAKNKNKWFIWKVPR